MTVDPRAKMVSISDLCPQGFVTVRAERMDGTSIVILLDASQARYWESRLAAVNMLVEMPAA